MPKQQASTLPAQRTELVHIARKLCDEIAARERHNGVAPQSELLELAAAGILTAPLPASLGGLGLGTEPGGHLPLLQLLTAVGSADLPLGRLFEGHVNALILINTFGTLEQSQQAAADAHGGLLFGVWNTGEGEPMRVDGPPESMRLHGCKGFATGAAFVQRPLVTAECRGWQMTLPRMEAERVASAVRIDQSSWFPLGMESSESYTIDLSGAELEPADLIGEPGDFYRDPLFRGGAIRFAAVQAGALLRFADMFAAWLRLRGRDGDPFQLQRMGEIALAAQEATLWIERAALVAEECLRIDASEAAKGRMVDCANMTRLAIERLATATMPRVIAGVGAHGLLRPAGFARLLRDLTMYLRQPNPDGTLVEVGRSALRNAESCGNAGAHHSFWNGSGS